MVPKDEAQYIEKIGVCFSLSLPRCAFYVHLLKKYPV